MSISKVRKSYRRVSKHEKLSEVGNDREKLRQQKLKNAGNLEEDFNYEGSNSEHSMDTKV